MNFLLGVRHFEIRLLSALLACFGLFRSVRFISDSFYMVISCLFQSSLGRSVWVALIELDSMEVTRVVWVALIELDSMEVIRVVWVALIELDSMEVARVVWVALIKLDSMEVTRVVWVASVFRGRLQLS